MDHSDIIWLSPHLIGDLALLEHFCSKLGALLRVLEHPRHLNGAGPVDVVEALPKNELLQCFLLQLALTVDHAVMVGNG